MSYSSDVKYIITAEDRNGPYGYNTNRYIGLDFDSNGDVNDFAIFYTVDGYLDYYKVYSLEEDAQRDLNKWKYKYHKSGNRRYNSLINIKIKSIVSRGNQL